MTSHFDRDHDVLGLEVAVYYLLSVQVLERQDRLSRVEVSMVLDARVLLDDLAQKSAAFDVFDLEIEITFVLEGRIELHDEWTLLVLIRVATGVGRQRIL